MLSRVQNLFSCVLRGSEIFSRVYLVGPKFFFVGISVVSFVLNLRGCTVEEGVDVDNSKKNFKCVFYY